MVSKGSGNKGGGNVKSSVGNNSSVGNSNQGRRRGNGG